MARQYSVVFQGVTVAAAQDFFEITAPATTGLRLLEVRLGTSLTTDSRVLVHIKRGTSGTISGLGGSAATPAKLDTNGVAAAATAEVNNTTIMSGGTITTVLADQFSVLSGWLYVPTPECQIACAPSERLCVATTSTPTSGSYSGTAIFEEMV